MNKLRYLKILFIVIKDQKILNWYLVLSEFVNDKTILFCFRENLLPGFVDSHSHLVHLQVSEKMNLLC